MPSAPVPLRRSYLLAALAFTALAVFGSLVPLKYEPVSWSEAAARFQQIPYLAPGPGSRADWVSNIVLFIPLTYFWMGALTLGRTTRARRWLIPGLVVLAAAAISVALEFTQIWFPQRTVTQNDILAETLGGAAGALLWAATGQATAEWLGGHTRRAPPQRQIDWLLEAYFVGFLIYAVLPLDLTISSGELLTKFREGRVTIVPFADVAMTWEALYGVVRDVAAFVPIGVLLSTWRMSDRRPVRSMGMTMLLGALVATAVESAQLLVLSRFTSATDILLSVLGAAFGAAVAMRWYRARQPEVLAVTSNAPLRRTLRWSALVLAYALVLVVVFCAPFDVSGTRQEWGARYQRVWAVPFATSHYESEYNAVSDILRKLLLFGVLGGLSAITVTTIDTPRAVRWLFLGVALAGATAVAGGIELAQVFLPPHIPDVTDVLVETAGAAVGMLVVMRWKRVSPPRSG